MSTPTGARRPAPWTDPEVRDALLLRPAARHRDLEFGRICTDTRRIDEGDLFVALEGPNFDGHDFLSEAAARGARGAVVHRSAPSEGLLALYPVQDTLEALGALAAYRRRTFDARVLAITGSSGKTTVKELVRAALEGSFRVHATHGNLNNRIGLPLTLLATPTDAQVVVVELGTNEPGEIAILTAIAEPDAAIVTTIGEAHLERLGSLEGVLAEKLSLVEGVAADGWVVVGDEPPELARVARERHSDVTVTGLSLRASERWRGEHVDTDANGRWQLRTPAGTVRSGIPGRHGALDALLAMAATEKLGVSFDETAPRIEAVEPGEFRSELRTLGRLTLIVDCYNANPQSMRAALHLLTDYVSEGARGAVLGSMLELGERASDLHREILDETIASGIEIVVAVGEFGAAAEAFGPPPSGTTLLAAEDADEAYRVLRPHLTGDETILLKGSRGVGLEVLIPRFESDFGTVAPRDDGGTG